MKMFLTRMGFGSKVVITGDQTQKDLPAGTSSGLDQALKVLSRVEDIGFSYLTSQDVVRHPLVQKIVQAYDDFDARTAKREQDRAQRRKEASRNFLARKTAEYAERTAEEEVREQPEATQNRAERRAQAARQERDIRKRSGRAVGRRTESRQTAANRRKK